MSKIKNVNYILIAVLLIFIVCGGILSYFLNKKEPIPISKKENAEIKKEKIQKEETAPIIPVPPKEIWETYTNSELGFSIKYPQMVAGVDKCSSNEKFYVPLKVFEDNANGIVYITEEYYYDDWDSETQSRTESCKKIINSLEYLKSQREITVDINDGVSLNSNPFLTRVFVIKDIKNDIELDKFIKDNYGPSCFEKDREQKKHSSVYDIIIKGTDWSKDGDSERVMTCARNYMYKILYAPEKNKAMSVKLGQECGFYVIDLTNINSPKCYDDIMIDSFRFE